MKLNYDTTVIPNFFKKGDIEIFLNRKLEKGEFQKIKKYLEESMMDEIEYLVNSYLKTYKQQKRTYSNEKV